LPQEPSVFRKLSVADNIKAALQTKFKNIEIEDKYTSIMKEFDLFSLEKQISENLSGGQRRKLEIARAFALEPKFILLDEPFAGIDPLTINEIKNIISKLRAKNVGVVISDHNAQATMDICDNISVINNGEIIASGNSSSIKENNTVQQIYLGENLT
jgi:lipopolysaccharide export system ATP-binding protein